MAVFTIRGFRGELPRVSDRLLQPNQATRGRNITLTSGRLDPLSKPLEVTTPTSAFTLSTIYRYRYVDAAGQPQDNWLVWKDPVDAVGSVISNDTLGRVYYSSENHEPRMTSYAAAITVTPPYPTAFFVLGVTPPITKPTVAVVGGATTTETRSYVYTLVSQYGEESAPSPPSTAVTGFINGTWNVTAMQVAPTNNGTISAVANSTPTAGFVTVTFNTAFGLAAHEVLTIASVLGMTSLNATHRIVSVNTTTNQVVLALTTAQVYTSGGTWTRVAPHNTTGMLKRIYRTAGTDGTFLFVAEIAAATTSYADTVLGTALGETLPTVNASPPPKNMRALTALPNGCLAGLANNELCFSEPYLPDSWPAANRYGFAGRGVALCATGNSVIVLTDGFPVLFTGTDPEAMMPSVMETYAPCASKRGTVNVGGGCIYPSYDGLWLAQPGRVENITKALFRQSEWEVLNPATFVAAFHDGRYIASYTRTDAVAETMLLDVLERDSVSFVDEAPAFFLRSELDGKLYILLTNKIQQWAANPVGRYSADWISGTMQVAKPTNFAVAQVFADFSPAVVVSATDIAANAALMVLGEEAVAGDLNGSQLLDVEINGSNLVLTDTTQYLRTVQFTLYADSVPVFTREVTSATPFRMPSGYRSEVFNVGVYAAVPVHSVSIAHSMVELSQGQA